MPEINATDSLPGLPLEVGDRILIPVAPGVVYAVDAVASSNDLLWRKGRTVKQHLMVAGLAMTADEDSLFILRDDGSTVHRRDSGWLLRGFESTELAQGDTLVAPEKSDLENTWSGLVRGFKDWPQILSNLGLAAAAIQTLSRRGTMWFGSPPAYSAPSARSSK